MSEKSNKLRNQVKSRFYYLFWGIATFSVVAGQLYVGQGFRRMADQGDVISADINLLVEVLTMQRPKTMPVPKQDPIMAPDPERGMGYWNSIIIPRS